jgi:hypothetical protein
VNTSGKWKEATFMASIFNMNMTNSEVDIAYFQAIEGKNKEERAKIDEELRKFIPRFTQKNLELAAQGWLTN